MNYELCIYRGGTAVLSDEEGETLWASDADDDFAQEFDEVVTYEDADDIIEYLEDMDYLPEGCAVDIVESKESGLDLTDDDGDDIEDDEDDDAIYDA